MNKFGILNIVIIFLVSIASLCIGFFSVVNKNFKDVPSMLGFLENANVYNNVSDIVRLEIESRYPKTINNSIILSGLANKLLDFVVTPQTVEKVAKPALNLSVKFAQAPTSIIDNNVVIATAKYKNQARETLSGFGLPKILLVNAGFLIDSIPAHLTIVNLEKHPNSILGIIIKLRTALKYSHKIVTISWIVMILALIFAIGNNIHRIKDLLKTLWIGFGISGGLIILLFLARGTLFAFALPNSSDPITLAQNRLVIDAVGYLLSQVKQIGVIYMVIAIISFVLYAFVKLDKVQSHINKVLRKLHIHVPQVTVEVK
ncbi:MAG TPA: hypothetical protein VG917_00630 [Patescibacteria group bacterium]|nr:hypothetical protein [Patescibacteria group bacterium]